MRLYYRMYRERLRGTVNLFCWSLYGATLARVLSKCKRNVITCRKEGKFLLECLVKKKQL